MEARILVVDDDPGTREAITHILTRAGFRVISWDGHADLEAVTAGLPLRLALVDYHLPGLTGLEVARRLKEQAPGCRIVLMSSEAPNPAERREWPDLVDMFLSKPFSKGSLLQVVQSLWSGE
jgi:CheY-like chemotaxis protein